MRSYLYLKCLNINNNNKKEKNDLELKALKNNSTVATQLEHKWLNVIHKCARIVQVRVQSRLRLRLGIQIQRLIDIWCRKGSVASAIWGVASRTSRIPPFTRFPIDTPFSNTSLINWSPHVEQSTTTLSARTLDTSWFLVLQLCANKHWKFVFRPKMAIF